MTRRTFLSAVGTGGVGAFCVGSEGARIVKSFGTYGLPGMELEKAINLVGEIGFDSVEIATMPGYHGNPSMLNADQRRSIRKQVGDSGLVLGALMGLPSPSAKDGLNRVEEVIQLALDLTPRNQSTPIIQSVLGKGDWDAQRDRYRDVIGPWVEKAEEHGVVLSIKPHRGQAMSKPEQAGWLIDQIGKPKHLGMVFDYSHFAYREMPVGETVKVALPYTNYIVIKDAVKEPNGKVRFQLPGESGKMPHSEVLKRFFDGGYRGDVCCEVSSHVWKAKGYDPAEGAKTCHRNLVAIWKELGW